MERAACLVVFAILASYWLQENRFGTLNISLFFLCGLTAGCLWFKVFTKTRTRKPMEMVAGSNRTLWMASTLSLFAAGLIYGAVRAGQLPVHVDGDIGKPITAMATVQTVTQGQPYPRTYLVIHDIRTSASSRHCHVVVLFQEPRVHGRSSAVLKVGDEVRVVGTLVVPPVRSANGSPVRAHLHSIGVDYSFDGQVQAVMAPKPSLGASLRGYIEVAIAHVPGIPSHEATLVESIVFGGTQVGTQTKQAFLVAGLLHVLAASGANIMIMESGCRVALFPLWRKLRLPYPAWVVALICFTWLFAATCGFDSSVVRAACMTTYRLCGEWVGRKHRLQTSLIFTLLAVCLGNPQDCLSMSAVLSFAATAAVCQALHTPGPQHRQTIVQRGRLATWGGLLVRYLYALFKITLYVELYLLPVTVTVFHQVTPFSLLSNLVMDPVVVLLLPIAAGWIVIVLAADWLPILMGVAQAGSEFVLWLLALLEGWVQWVAGWPYALIAVPSIPTWVCVPYYLLLWTYHLVRKKMKGYTP